MATNNATTDSFLSNAMVEMYLNLSIVKFLNISPEIVDIFKHIYGGLIFGITVAWSPTTVIPLVLQ